MHALFAARRIPPFMVVRHSCRSRDCAGQLRLETLPRCGSAATRVGIRLHSPGASTVGSNTRQDAFRSLPLEATQMADSKRSEAMGEPQHDESRSYETPNGDGELSAQPRWLFEGHSQPMAKPDRGHRLHRRSFQQSASLAISNRRMYLAHRKVSVAIAGCVRRRRSTYSTLKMIRLCGAGFFSSPSRS